MNKIGFFALILIAYLIGSQASAATYSFARNLWLGVNHADVSNLQRTLNSDPATRVALSGAGSPGLETSYFGARTQAAVIKFQKKYGIAPAAGYVGPLTRARLNVLQGSVSANTAPSAPVTSSVPAPAAPTQPAPTPMPTAPTAPVAHGKVCNTALIGSDGYSPHNMIDRETCERLNELYSQGRAAGNAGDLYANRDNLHVNFCHDWTPSPDCPQANRLFYQHDWQISGGGAAASPYSQPTLGQASYSGSVTGGIKHSIVYDKYRSQAGADQLYTLYSKNNLFMYPSLHEESSEGNPNVANTPYVIATRQICDCGAGFLRIHDASGSEMPFIELGMAGLAAFKPDVKERLKEKEALMPTLQALMRYAHRSVSSESDYLSGSAHPSSYLAHYLDGQNILPAYDARELVDAANSLTLASAPPVVRLSVVSETFSSGEKVFATPGAIARKVSTGSPSREMTVSAESSVNPDGSTGNLEYRFVVLKGQSRATVTQDGSERASIEFAPGDSRERIDVGVFARKSGGAYWSVPGMISLYREP
jgi:hypothetical protein